MDNDTLITVLNTINSILATTVVVSTTIHDLDIVFKNKLRLQKISKYDNCIITENHFIDNHTIEERKSSIDEENKKYLLSFLTKLEAYTSKENLTVAYHNIKSLELYRFPRLIMLFVNIMSRASFSGVYIAQTNNLATIKKDSAFSHEFLHMCSTSYDEENDIIYNGFSQSCDTTYIGIGLTEGYTELLKSRIYNNNKTTAYSKEVKIAKLFEFFFDNPKDMEKFYFKHDLPGFIHYMEKFAPKQEIIDILLKIDSINLLGDSILPISIIEYTKVQLELYKWFIKENKNPEKLQQFTNLLCKNKIVSMILNNKKMKLYKENIYSDQTQISSLEEHNIKK